LFSFCFVFCFFVDRCLSFCTFSCHSIVCPFVLFLVVILLSVLLYFFLLSFYCLSFCSFSCCHSIVCPFAIYDFQLFLSYLQTFLTCNHIFFIVILKNTCEIVMQNDKIIALC
jgi:hypothetical protein